MDKVDTKELTKAVNSLVSAIREHNKYVDKQNQQTKENNEILKDLKTRLTSVANAISNGGTIVSK